MPVADKIDLYAEHKDEYAAKTKPALVEVGPAIYLSVTGKGTPGSEGFTTAIGALYGVAFTVKMTRKFAGEQDYAVCKLECLYGDPSSGAMPEKPEDWPWQMMIRTPEFVTKKELAQAVAVLKKRGKGEDADAVELIKLKEGKCVQMLHVGPYDAVCKTIAVMKAFAESKGLSFRGRHHEIYLSDPRRIPPEKLRTIVRHPVGK